jgi:plasmid stabilization system protein ParE
LAYHDALQEFPDLGSLDHDDLRAFIRALEHEEHRLSYRRRLLHGQIGILRAELANRSGLELDFV